MRFSHYTQSFLFLVLLLSGVPAFAQQNRVFIEDHDSLTVYYPRFNRIDFVTKQMAPEE